VTCYTFLLRPGVSAPRCTPVPVGSEEVWWHRGVDGGDSPEAVELPGSWGPREQQNGGEDSKGRRCPVSAAQPFEAIGKCLCRGLGGWERLQTLGVGVNRKKKISVAWTMLAWIPHTHHPYGALGQEPELWRQAGRLLQGAQGTCSGQEMPQLPKCFPAFWSVKQSPVSRDHLILRW